MFGKDLRADDKMQLFIGRTTSNKRLPVCLKKPFSDIKETTVRIRYCTVCQRRLVTDTFASLGVMIGTSGRITIYIHRNAFPNRC